MEGWGDDLRKWDMLIRAASARCAVKTDSCDYHIPVINLSLSLSDPTLLLTVFTHGLQAQTADGFNHAHRVEHI